MQFYWHKTADIFIIIMFNKNEISHDFLIIALIEKSKLRLIVES